MPTIRDIEDAVRQLPPEALAEFRQWFAEFDAAAWDRQLEADAGNRRLDSLAEEALTTLDRGAAPTCEAPCQPTLLEGLPRSARRDSGDG